MSDKKSHQFGIRVVAIFEAVKALFLVVVGSGLLSLIHRDMDATANYLIQHLHLNPAHKYPRIFIDFASHITDSELWFLALLALFDAVIRAVEAVGLWYQREWGKWLGILTASLYLPIEVFEMTLHLTWLKTLTFIINVIIVVYLISTLHSPSRRPDSNEIR